MSYSAAFSSDQTRSDVQIPGGRKPSTRACLPSLGESDPRAFWRRACDLCERNDRQFERVAVGRHVVVDPRTLTVLRGATGLVLPCGKLLTRSCFLFLVESDRR